LTAGPFVGVDLGARAVQAVSLDESGKLAEAKLFAADEGDGVAAWAARAKVIAIDAPDRPSSGAHARDERLAPKFRQGRCAEAALGLEHRYWVPWVTPTEPEAGSWIELGIGLHERLRQIRSCEVIEVFPYAAFRHLAPEPLPKKTTVAGVRTRVRLLRQAGLDHEGLEAWSHDFVDAALAALIALQRSRGEAVRVTCPGDSPCEHDGSAIWLPRPLPR
jgi:predicted nuclease with RNAse H fold